MIASLALTAVLGLGAPQQPEPALIATVRAVEACFARQMPASMPASYDETVFLTRYGFTSSSTGDRQDDWGWTDDGAIVVFAPARGCTVVVSAPRLTEDRLIGALTAWGDEVGFGVVSVDEGYVMFELKVTGSAPTVCAPFDSARGGVLHGIDVDTVEAGLWSIEFSREIWCE